MSGADHDDQVRTWLRYAREDLEGADAALARSGAIPRHACFLAQQAAEKALKAVLVFLKIDVPRRHDLDGIRNLIPPDWRVTREHPLLGELTDWAVDARYPDDLTDPTEVDARAAVEQARAVWESVRRDFAERGLFVEDARRHIG